MRRLFTIILLFLTGITYAQVVQQKLPDKTRILFLLDGSGSMLAKWGKTTRIEAAKHLLSGLVDSLKAVNNVQVALRAYGHRYSRQAQNCQDTKLEVGFSSNNHQLIINRLSQIQPKGTTPIAYSLQEAANDFPPTSEYRNIIIIITDGIESCDGDPCAVSLALQRKNIFLKPFIIGIGMDRKFAREFGCMGEFYDAKDELNFKKALNKALATSLELTSASVEILDENNQPAITNINVSFINSFTQQAAADYVHYLDREGKPDSVELDPVLNYDVTVNSIPPVVKRNVRLRPGIHNVIQIAAPQGDLNLKQKGSSAYPNDVVALIKSEGKIIYVQPMNTAQSYLQGSYDIEILTVPRQIFRNVKVEPKKTRTINLPDPGILNISHNAPGYGSIYAIDEAGRQTWVYDLDHNQKRITLAVQPGIYKIVFRAGTAPGSKYTAVKTVNIAEGKSIVVNVFN